MSSKKRIHKMLIVDKESRVGICRHCGQVPLSSVGRTKGGAQKLGCRWAVRCWERGISSNIPVPPSRCEICKRETQLCIDHNHSKMSFRGYICRRCNGMLGYWRESEELIRGVLEYIKR